MTTERMVEVVRDIQSKVNKKLEQTNMKYKVAADNYRCSKIFKEGNLVIVFYARSASSMHKLHA